MMVNVFMIAEVRVTNEVEALNTQHDLIFLLLLMNDAGIASNQKQLEYLLVNNFVFRNYPSHLIFLWHLRIT